MAFECSFSDNLPRLRGVGDDPEVIWRNCAPKFHKTGILSFPALTLAVLPLGRSGPSL